VKQKEAAKTKKPTRKHHGLLADIGTGVGSIFGGTKGAAIGRGAGAILGDIFGWGDYEVTSPVPYPVKSNTIMGSVHPQQMPLMHTGDGGTRVAHREFCMDLQLFAEPAGGPFMGRFYELNPCNPNIFPWLSSIAEHYEQYKFIGLTFGFRGTASNTTVEGSLGSVAFATQYDVYEKLFNHKSEMLNSLFATSCKPTDSMLHPIECDPDKTPSLPRYTNAQSVVGSVRDKTLINHGRLTVLAAKTQATSTVYDCGELWVSYDILLTKPIATISTASPLVMVLPDQKGMPLSIRR